MPYQTQRGEVVSVPWVGMLVFLLAAGVFVWWMLSSGASSASNSGQSSSAVGQQPGLEAQAVTAPVGADGKQTLDLVVNGNTRSYEPRVVKVKQGVPVRFNLSSKGADPG